MKITKFIIVVFCLISWNSYGQKKKFIELDPADLSLSVQEFYFSKVIDNRLNKESIGSVRKGMANKSILADFKMDFSFHILSTISQVLKPGRDKEALVLRINRFSISEHISFSSETARCEMSIDILRKRNDEFELIGSFDANKEIKGMEVTPFHDENILATLAACIELFAKDRTESENFVKISENDLVDTTVERQSRMITFSDSIQRGLYLNFWELASGKPSLGIKFYVKKTGDRKDFVRYEVFDQMTDKKIKKFYAFSSGGEIYLSASQYHFGSYFVKATGNGRYITFEDRFSDPNVTIAAGLLGAAMSNKKRLIVIDKESGFLSEFRKPNITKLLIDYPEIEVKWEKSKKDFAAIAAVMRLVNKACALKKVE